MQRQCILVRNIAIKNGTHLFQILLCGCRSCGLISVENHCGLLTIISCNVLQLCLVVTNVVHQGTLSFRYIITSAKEVMFSPLFVC